MDAPRATIIIPTYRHSYTLDLSIESALNQTIEDIEVIVLGDGVDDATRAVVDRYWRHDPRVRFMDLPKGPNHGEEYRNDAVLAARAPIVGYLCDDDLFFPEHVEDMLKLLGGADFAHSLNGYFRPDGTFDPYPADLSDPACLAWHERWGRNGVSLTGAFHTVDAFLRLPQRWYVPEPDQMIDHAMWRIFFAQPWLRAATSERVTTVQLPSHLDGRVTWTPDERRRELEQWAARISMPGERAAIDAAIVAGFGKRASALMVALGAAHDHLDAMRIECDSWIARYEAVVDHDPGADPSAAHRGFLRRVLGRIRRSFHAN
jgi:glycosyltransferase involved in cell wall biosynthesis